MVLILGLKKKKKSFGEFLELQKLLTKASDCLLDDAGMGRRWNKSLQTSSWQ